MIPRRAVGKQVDKRPIDSVRWPAMPDPQDTGRGGEVWLWPRVRCHFQIAPTNARDMDYLVFPYAMSVFDHHGRHILSIVLEQTDYRMLAQLSGASVRELREERKGNFSPLHSAVYTHDKHDDLGPYEGDMDKESIRKFFLDIVADELDLFTDPILKGAL